MQQTALKTKGKSNNKSTFKVGGIREEWKRERGRGRSEMEWAIVERFSPHSHSPQSAIKYFTNMVNRHMQLLAAHNT